jgi:hypothetical protein
MADGIRLDLQRALAEGPGAIPNMEPLFAPGAIPPIFDEAPELDEGAFIPSGGIPPSGATATFPGEPIDIGNAPIGSPVPPARRENRIRALLGNFLQNFGEGLQAASRAPSGSEFAAGFGAALSEPEARRQQQVFENLSRANQALKRQVAEQTARFQQETLDAEERTRQAGRIERELDRAESARRFEETGRRQTMGGILERNRARRARAGTFEFRRQQQKRLRESIAGEGKLNRQLQRELATTKAASKFPQSERTNLAEAIASRVGNIQGSELIPGGGFRARLQLSKIKAKIDRLFRAGLSPDEIANEFDLAIQGVKGTVTLKGVLDNLADEPVR